MPVFKNIRLTGQPYRKCGSAIYDGRKGLNVLANLDKTLSSDGAELVNAWKKQLRWW
jgi:preprotein translocase subunit SecA